MTVVGLSAIVAGLVVAATYLSPPVYFAKTVMTLDSELSKAVPAGLSLPTIDQQSYIRYEFFAEHGLNLMQLPELSEEVITELNLTASGGEALAPEHFIKPGLFRLLASNGGRGVNPEWVTDTQQFSISGLSRSPAEAVAISEAYTRAFLAFSTRQYRDSLAMALERSREQAVLLKARLSELEAQQASLRASSGVHSADQEISVLADRMSDLREKLVTIDLDEAAYAQKAEHLSLQAEKLGVLREYQRVMQANPLLESLRGRMNTLSEEYASLAVSLTPEHPELQEAEAALDHVRKALQSTVAQTFQQSSEQRPDAYESVLSQMLDVEVNHALAAVMSKRLRDVLAEEEKRLELVAGALLIERDIALQRESLVNFMSQAEAEICLITSIMNKPISLFRTVSGPRFNEEASSQYRFFPKRKKLAAIALMTVLIIGGASVVGRELLANPLYRVWQIQAVHPQLLAVEWSGGGYWPPRMPDATARAPLIPLAQAAMTSQAIHLEGDVQQTAPVAAALARLLAEAGRRVLVVDGDVEGGGFGGMLLGRKAPGLADWMLRGQRPETMLVHVDAHGFDVLPAGAEGKALLEYSPDRAALPEEFLRDYDAVVLVSPMHRLDASLLVRKGQPVLAALALTSGRHSIHAVLDWLARCAASGRLGPVLILGSVASGLDLLTWRGAWFSLMRLLRMPVRWGESSPTSA